MLVRAKRVKIQSATSKAHRCAESQCRLAYHHVWIPHHGRQVTGRAAVCAESEDLWVAALGDGSLDDRSRTPSIGRPALHVVILPHRGTMPSGASPGESRGGDAISVTTLAPGPASNAEVDLTLLSGAEQAECIEAAPLLCSEFAARVHLFLGALLTVL